MNTTRNILTHYISTLKLVDNNLMNNDSNSKMKIQLIKKNYYWRNDITQQSNGGIGKK